LLDQLVQASEYDLSIQIVGETEMARLNQLHLGHEGSTDVITLDYGDPVANAMASVSANGKRTQFSFAGELMVCADEAVIQARRFRVHWTNELVRYCVHGVLHLCGHDDRAASARRRMKSAEDRLMATLARRFDLRKLARKTKVSA
ncbi:MAG TPA: rRNA maturation RNase YbeY, partial [Verrucomicrobiae bacterium]|nr:rRNA maturation RNase YbeY [Verrucomicrobiae bacterium]